QARRGPAVGGASRNPRGRRGRAAAPRPPDRRAPDRGLGGEQVEGRRAVAELLAAGRRRTRGVWLADDLDPAPIIDEIVERANERRVPVRRVPRARLESTARTGAPQGVLARADPLPEADFDELCQVVPGRRL